MCTYIYIYASTNIYMHMCIYTYIHIDIHTYVHVYVYTCIAFYIHTYTHIALGGRPCPGAKWLLLLLLPPMGTF